jgi:hypothetical protein
MTISNENMSTLLKVFGDADKLTVNFPQGDEPQWTTKMEGSRKAANAFRGCMHDVQQTAGTQPVLPQPTGNARVKDDGGI